MSYTLVANKPFRFEGEWVSPGDVVTVEARDYASRLVRHGWAGNTAASGGGGTPVVILTQAEYDALDPVDENTLYAVVG